MLRQQKPVTWTFPLLMLVLVLALFAPAAQAQSIVRIDGSSTVFPVTEAVARAFQVHKRGTARVTVGISGTTGGFRRFCRGETDMQDASRPILTSELETCRASGVRFLELPVAFDAVTLAVNPRNTWVKSLSVADLKKIWEPAAQGRVRLWSDIDPQWPAEPLMLLGPDVDSGTFDYFTEVIVGTRGASRKDYVSSDDDDVIAYGIENNLYALGYIPHAYFASQAHRLRGVPIDSGSGPVSPALENVGNRSYTPLSRPLFIYVNAQSAQRAEVRSFMEFLFARAPQLLRGISYLPLSESAYTMAAENFRNGKLGTVFNGRPETGLRAEEILARTPKH